MECGGGWHPRWALWETLQKRSVVSKEQGQITFFGHLTWAHLRICLASMDPDCAISPECYCIALLQALQRSSVTGHVVIFYGYDEMQNIGSSGIRLDSNLAHQICPICFYCTEREGKFWEAWWCAGNSLACFLWKFPSIKRPKKIAFVTEIPNSRQKNASWEKTPISASVRPVPACASLLPQVHAEIYKTKTTLKKAQADKLCNTRSSAC